jgi:hypothetical protein
MAPDHHDVVRRGFARQADGFGHRGSLFAAHAIADWFDAGARLRPSASSSTPAVAPATSRARSPTALVAAVGAASLAVGEVARHEQRMDLEAWTDAGASAARGGAVAARRVRRRARRR